MPVIYGKQSLDMCQIYVAKDKMVCVSYRQKNASSECMGGRQQAIQRSMKGNERGQEEG